MDTKTIMTVLALLGSGTLLDGCDDAATREQAPPESEPASSAPVKTEPERAPSESKSASTDSSAPAKTETAPAKPEDKPAITGHPATAEVERARPAKKRTKTPGLVKVEAKEVTPAGPANPAGQGNAETKGEMKCGEGGCGAAPSTVPHRP